jgi:hypothetical protein
MIKIKVCVFLGLYLSFPGLFQVNALAEQPVQPQVQRSLSFVAEEPAPVAVMGRQFLFVIGIGNYQHWLPLNNPVKDAQDIKAILTTRYYIDEVVELYDEQATKANILKAFNDLQLKLETDDSLLIYYAGHGHFDKKTNTGFWIPYDAGLDTFAQENWLPNLQVKGVITNINAIHICLIADSCFAGNILDIMRGTREIPVNNDIQGGTGKPELAIDHAYFQRSYALISRQVITAGAFETVPDTSTFSYMLKRVLDKNIHPYLDPFMLFNEIRLGVTETTPLIGTLKETGHQEGASFLFFLRKEYWPQTGPLFKAETVTGPRLPQVITPVPVPEEAGLQPRSRFFSLSLGLGISVPTGDVSTLMETGIHPLYCLSYNLAGEYGELGIGLYSGIAISSTKESFMYQYYLVSFPLAFQIQYRFLLFKPLYGYIETNTGLAINFIKYRQAYEELADSFTAKFFLAPALGLGIRFNPQLRLAAACYYTLIFFDKHIYTGITPGFKLDIQL